MKLLVVDPGADWSTRDVYEGLCHGLRAQAGVEVLEYRYGRRFSIMRDALQTAWRRDKNRVKPTDADAALWTSELAVTWALRHQPDWLVVVSGMYFHPDALVLARRAGIKTAILLTESPYDYEKEWEVARLADLCWTNERTAVAPLRSANAQTHYLAHAYHPERHTPEASGTTSKDSPFYRPELETVPAHDVVFVGTGFQERVDLLSAVDWTGINFGLYGTWLLPSRHRLRKFTPLGQSGIVENTSTAALYARAKVGLNLFRQSKGFGKHALRLLGAESLNPRSYELAATGCFHISDRRPEVGEVFGDLVPTFDTAEELTQLLRHWLGADAERARRAALLPEAVRGHSWVDRAGQVVADLRRAARRDAVA